MTMLEQFTDQSALTDVHGRIADRLRISLTDRCDLRCSYCMPFTGNHFHPNSELLTNKEVVQVARFLVEKTGVSRIRLTGGEPLLRPGLVDLVGELAALKIDDLALTTNAQLLAPQADALAEAGLNRVNISLDTLDPDQFKRYMRVGELQKTLDGIDAAIEAGLTPIKLNAVLMKGMNDTELRDLVRYSLKKGVEIRFLELMAIGEAAADHDNTYITTVDAIAILEEEFSVTPMDFVPGETARQYGIQNGSGPGGTIGFIAPVSNPFCSSCRRLRLSATGKLRGCLMNSSGPDLREVLRSGDPKWEDLLLARVVEAIGQKPWLSTMATGVNMHRLGG